MTAVAMGEDVRSSASIHGNGHTRNQSVRIVTVSTINTLITPSIYTSIINRHLNDQSSRMNASSCIQSRQLGRYVIKRKNEADGLRYHRLHSSIDDHVHTNCCSQTCIHNVNRTSSGSIILGTSVRTESYGIDHQQYSPQTYTSKYRSSTINRHFSK